MRKITHVDDLGYVELGQIAPADESEVTRGGQEVREQVRRVAAIGDMPRIDLGPLQGKYGEYLDMVMAHIRSLGFDDSVLAWQRFLRAELERDESDEGRTRLAAFDAAWVKLYRDDMRRRAPKPETAEPEPEPAPAPLVRRETPKIYDPAAGETRDAYLRRRRAEVKTLDARTPEELIAAVEADDYLREAFYRAVLALPKGAVPAPAAPKRGVLARVGGWFRRQAADVADDWNNPTGFVKPDDWLARKAEIARRILASREIKADVEVRGEAVVEVADRLAGEFRLAA